MASSYPYSVALCQSMITRYQTAIERHLDGEDARSVSIGGDSYESASLRDLEKGLTMWQERLVIAQEYAASSTSSTLRPVLCKMGGPT